MKSVILFLLVLLLGTSQAIAVEIPNKENIIKIYNLKDESEGLPQEFRILTWNIYKGKKKFFSRDFKFLSEIHDILILQEAIDRDPVRSLVDSLEFFEFFMAIAWIDESESEATGIMTASRYKSQRHRWYQSLNREPILKTPKMSLLNFYYLENSSEKLAVLNMHTLNFVGQKKFESMFTKTIELLNGHQGPIVFAGDFNTWSSKRLSYMRKSLSLLNLKAVTFSPDKRTRFMGKPLDHIWVRGLEVLSSKVYSELNSSDHKALSVRLKLSI